MDRRGYGWLALAAGLFAAGCDRDGARGDGAVAAVECRAVSPDSADHVFEDGVASSVALPSGDRLVAGSNIEVPGNGPMRVRFIQPGRALGDPPRIEAWRVVGNNARLGPLPKNLRIQISVVDCANVIEDTHVESVNPPNERLPGGPHRAATRYDYVEGILTSTPISTASLLPLAQDTLAGGAADTISIERLHGGFIVVAN